MMRSILYISALFVLFSCSKDSLSIPSYKTWVNDRDNGLYKKKVVEDFTVETVFKPLDWIILKDMDNKNFTVAEYDSVKNQYKGLQYFGLKITNEKLDDLVGYNSSDNNIYQANFNYFTGGMKNDIYLVENNDTLPCILFHYERNYGATKSSIFNLAFKVTGDKLNSNKQLVFDGQYLNLGILKFEFKKTDLNEIPKLKL